MKIGYARVSTTDQNLELQLAALEEAGCSRIFQEKISGAKKERPELERLLDQLGGILRFMLPAATLKIFTRETCQ